MSETPPESSESYITEAPDLKTLGFFKNANNPDVRRYRRTLFLHDSPTVVDLDQIHLDSTSVEATWFPEFRPENELRLYPPGTLDPLVWVLSIKPVENVFTAEDEDEDEDGDGPDISCPVASFKGFEPEWRSSHIRNAAERRLLWSRTVSGDAARSRYWGLMIADKPALWPDGVRWDEWIRTLSYFPPSVSYYNGFFHRLSCIRRWVADHPTWRDAKAAHRYNLNILQLLPPRLIYLAFIIGSQSSNFQVKGEQRYDLLHCSFHRIFYVMIIGCRIAFMAPKLYTLGDLDAFGPAALQASHEFWEGHTGYERFAQKEYQ